MTSPGSRSPPAPLTILLADDDEDFRLLLATVLRRDGHRVIELEDSTALRSELSRYSKRPRDRDLVIVADVRMPGGDSPSVLRPFKDAGALPPVMFMTAHADDRTQSAARDLGAVALFTKPFDLDDLRAAIAAVKREPASEG